jgi:hypothetical protein
MAEVKTIIELAQDGTPVRVLVAQKGAGTPLFDLTNQGVKLTPEEMRSTDPIPGHPRRATMAFHEGNCVIINGVKYCR